VAKLCESILAGGGDVRFGCEVTGVHRSGASATVRIAVPDRGGAPATSLEADVVIGCDGARGAVSTAAPSLPVVEQSVPVRWLAVIAEAPPIEPRTVYAAHPRGFAGQMRRTPSLTRYYLEVPAADPLAAWPAARIRDELSVRLGLTDELAEVGLVEPSFVDLRMRMISPLQDGPIVLAGDAAHLITPAGGKGMNLAIHDAVELAHGLVERFGPRRDATRSAAYSATRLPAIWRAQAFSEWFLRLLVAGSGPAGAAASPAAGTPGGSLTFEGGLRQGWISALGCDPLLAHWFAHAYAGVDPD
jgi:p-hydroxybenzoate 3-monooxygenase